MVWPNPFFPKLDHEAKNQYKVRNIGRQKIEIREVYEFTFLSNEENDASRRKNFIQKKMYTF